MHMCTPPHVHKHTHKCFHSRDLKIGEELLGMNKGFGRGGRGMRKRNGKEHA